MCLRELLVRAGLESVSEKLDEEGAWHQLETNDFPAGITVLAR